MTRLRTAVVAAALSLAFLGCGGSTEPRLEPLEGSYTLRSSNGIPLPAPLYAPGGPTIRAGTLIVLDSVRLQLDLRVGSSDADAYVYTLRYGYRLQGDSIVVPAALDAGGRRDGNTVRFNVSIPLPPSLGYVLYPHALVLAR